MTLRKKILLILGLVLAGWIALIYAISSLIMLDRIDTIEENRTRSSVQRGLDEIADRQRDLDRSARDWGAWNTPYEWMTGTENRFVEDYMEGNALPRLGVNLIAFIDTSGKVAAARAFDLAGKKPLPVPPELAGVTQSLLSLGEGKGGTGLLILGGTPVLIACRPVTMTDEKGPSVGRVMMGRFLDAEVIGQLSGVSQAKVELVPIGTGGSAGLSPPERSNLAQGREILVQVKGRRSIEGHAVLSDISGKPALVLRAERPRELHHQGRLSLLTVLVSQLAIGAILTLVIIVFLDRAILRRVMALAREVRVSASKATTMATPAPVRGDELANLGEAVRLAFSELEDYRTSLEASRDDLEEMVEARTLALSRSNEELLLQINERRQIEKVRTATYQISEAANSAKSLQDLYPALRSIIATLMPAQNFYIGLYDPEVDLFRFPYFVDQYDEPPPPRKPGRGLTDFVFRTGKSILVTPQIFEDLSKQGEVEYVGTPSAYWLGVPLRIQEQTIGVLAVQSYSEGVRYSQEHKDILQFVSAQVAMAIQRKHDEESLKKSEERYRTLVGNLGEGLAIVDPEENFLFANAAAESIFGVQPGTLAGMNLGEFASEETLRKVREQTAFLRTGEKGVYEIEILRSDQESRVLRATAVPQFGEGGQFVLSLVLFFDVTQELVWQEELQRARRLEAVGLVAGGVAHEVRNPLFALSTITAALEKKLGNAEPVKPFLDHIYGQVKKLGDLMNDLLTLGKPLDSAVCQPYTLQGVVTEALHLLDHAFPEASSRFSVQMEEQPLPSHGSPEKLARAVLNLVQNAHQISPHSEHIRIRGSGDKQTMTLEVSDLGPGIPAELLPKIFEPFQSRRKGGTGLGLAIVRKIVEDHGGYITASNNDPGPGATFRLVLPLLQKEELERRLQTPSAVRPSSLLEEREDRRKMQEKLVNSERRFRAVFEGAGDSIFLMSGDTFVECNEKTCEVYGCTKKEEILCRKPYDFSPPTQPDGRDSKEKALEKINAALAGEPQFFEWMHCKLDRTPFLAEVSLSRVFISGKAMVQAIVRDIQQRKQAEIAVKESEGKLLSLVETMNEGIMAVDNDDRILYVNGQACAMFDYSEEELVGKTSYRLLANPEFQEVIKEKNRQRTLGVADRYELELLKKGGEPIWVLISGSPIRNAEGEVIGSLGVLADITERKRAEEERARIETEHRRTRAFESLKILTQGLAHEVRNPVFAINLNLTALEKQVEDRGEIGPFLCHMRDQVKRLDVLMRDVIEMGRPLAEGEFVDCTAQEILQGAMDLVQASSPGSLERVCIVEPETPLKVRAVPAKLSLAIAHLVKNALEWTRAQGGVKVAVGAEDGCLVARVSDEGPGLPEKLKGILFEPFVTSRTGHTGLGLALAKHYVDNHGGTITAADNAPPPGATFTVTLPIIENGGEGVT